MITESYRIVGGNFEIGGSASVRLKERLKKIGIDPKIMRRIMIAAYEAEMNVVIHAERGNMWINFDEGQIEIEVTDEGPGIPDINQAMEEGFSTASPAARELGFGAGLGLPYIKKNSDFFEIESTPGKGTRVRSTINLQLPSMHLSTSNSLRVRGELCCECLHCLHSCPTRALRVLNGIPKIMKHLCIDCAACIAICHTGALTVDYSDEVPDQTENVPLFIPSSLLAQFGSNISLGGMLASLHELGYGDVYILEQWDRALHEAVMKYAREEAHLRPVISPVCPAVVNLIEMRFPSLIENLAPFLSPVEAALIEVNPLNAVVVAECPALHTALMSVCASTIKIITPSALIKAVSPLIKRNNDNVDEQIEISPLFDRSTQYSRKTLRVSGVRNVVNVLDQVENGLLNDLPVLVPHMCNQGCFGSPLLPENPYVAGYRRLHISIDKRNTAGAVRRTRPFYPREGLRLDTDMTSAIMKLSKIDELSRSLPGKNCGRCGAPTCSSLAEDIVMGRATKEACIYLVSEKEQEI